MPATGTRPGACDGGRRAGGIPMPGRGPARGCRRVHPSPAGAESRGPGSASRTRHSPSRRRPSPSPADLAPRWRWMFVQSAPAPGDRAASGWRGMKGASSVIGGDSGPGLKLGAEERPAAWLVDTMVLESHRAARGNRAALMVQAREDSRSACRSARRPRCGTFCSVSDGSRLAPLQMAQRVVRGRRTFCRGRCRVPSAWAAGLGVRPRGLVRDGAGRALEDRRRGTSTGSASGTTRSGGVSSRPHLSPVVRDASYLNWKYVAQPGQAFVRLELRRAGALVGNAVLMFRAADRGIALPPGVPGEHRRAATAMPRCFSSWFCVPWPAPPNSGAPTLIVASARQPMPSGRAASSCGDRRGSSS